jgi:CRISPR-associated protein Cmr6
MPTSSRRDRLANIHFNELASTHSRLKSTNASLWFDKFIESQDAKSDGEDRSAEKPKQTLIDEMTRIAVSDIYRSFYERWTESLHTIGAETRVLCIDGRMIVGLGAESVLETSITLNRTYGVPFIPGSALKGLAAKYAAKLEDARWRKDAAPIIEISEGKKINPHQFIFGSQDSAGFIVFHDALLIPEQNSRLPLHAEIMTVHHAGYYADGEEPPADWDAPNPVPFLSASGKYLLALSAPTGAESWLKLTLEILRLALQAEGVGAKTSSGYGRATIERSAAEILAEQEAS